MILEFKTHANKNGNKHCLCIDTDAHIYSRNCRSMIIPGIEIKKKDMDELIEKFKYMDNKEVEFVW